LELAFALKFLSNADQAEHWGILKREVFIGIWIIIGILITLYLFGWIKFPHDTAAEKLPKNRIFIGVLFAAFTVYLVPGLTNTKWASLSLISGFPPPLSYSIYHDQTELRDLDEAMKTARTEHKPILLDFTGYACTNCRRMEELVWSKPGVSMLMQNKFIVVSLYVDDKKQLPAAEQFTYTTKAGAAKDINTVGDKWATLEEENFQTNSQPLYALINADGVLLNHPVGYTPDADQYESWLQCGLDAFKKKK
jgi:thioredoxin-related protein